MNAQARAGTADEAIDIVGGATMGTTWSVKFRAPAHADLHRVHAAVQACLDRIVAQVSNWDPTSDLSRYNAGEPGTWHALPADFDRVLRCALEIAEASHGAFDPTLGAVVDAWGFGSSRAVSVPCAHARDQWRRVVVDGDRVLQPGGVRLDFCAIAKGHAVDEVANVLRARGIDSALVEVGGELCAFGRKPDGAPWRVLVEGWAGDEDDANPARVIALDGMAIATSGDRWHQRRIGGRTRSHTIDPRTAAPVLDAPTAVTVVARDAMRADGWATALTVLGMQKGFALAARLDLPARFIDARDHREHMTPAFEGLTHA